jgi:hypothetical protein
VPNAPSFLYSTIPLFFCRMEGPSSIVCLLPPGGTLRFMEQG